MNKLFISVIGLCSIFSLIAMEEQNFGPITLEENTHFITHLKFVCTHSKNLITVGSLKSDNGIYKMLNQLFHDLANNKNEVTHIIDSKKLFDRLNEYKKFEIDSIVTSLKKDCSHSKEESSIKTLKTQLKERRVQLAREALNNKWPQYVVPTQSVQSNPFAFLVSNQNYPADNEEAVKDYLTMFIYQLIFAPRLEL